MFQNNGIEGRFVTLKSVTIEDAEFTLEIRQDSEISKYLPRINNTLQQQINWINKQRSKSNDYFFVVWDKHDNRIGTISIYDIESEYAEGGRLTMRGNAFQCIEAQLLCFRFAFVELKLNYVVSYIFVDNERALRFNKQFGGIIQDIVNKEGHEQYKVINNRADFFHYEEKIKSLMYR
jgi:RimJ/RimL family protein N-acetyltransferase